MSVGSEPQPAVVLSTAGAVTAFEDLARHVGVLAGKSGHDDIVDVAVVEGAIRRGDAIVTSNVTHIRQVAEAARAELRIESV